MKITFLAKRLLAFFCLVALASSFVCANEPEIINLDPLDPNIMFENIDFLTATSKRQTNSRTTKKKIQRQDVTNSWKPYWIMNRYIEPISSYFFSMDVGCGFLYFSEVTANLQLTELASVNELSSRNLGNQLQGSLSYNRTPAFEGVLGSKVLSWLSIALSYMHQGGIDIQTKPQWYGKLQLDTGVTGGEYILRTNLALDAILGKVYFNSPGSIIWKTIAFNPYFGVGVGPGWQTWSKISNEFLITDDLEGNFPIVHLTTIAYMFKQKICSNAVWMLDLGLKLKSVIPNLNFSVKLGTKFIGWGQARNIGLVQQQRNVSVSNTGVVGIFRPFRVKFLYSFTPYMGVQWNF